MRFEQPLLDLIVVYLFLSLVIYGIRKLLERGVKKRVSSNFYFVDKIFLLEKILIHIFGIFISITLVFSVSLGHLSIFFNFVSLVNICFFTVHLFRWRDVNSEHHDDKYEQVLITDESIETRNSLISKIKYFLTNLFPNYWESLMKGIRNKKFVLYVLLSSSSLIL